MTTAISPAEAIHTLERSLADLTPNVKLQIIFAVLAVQRAANRDFLATLTALQILAKDIADNA